MNVVAEDVSSTEKSAAEVTVEEGQVDIAGGEVNAHFEPHIEAVDDDTEKEGGENMSSYRNQSTEHDHDGGDMFYTDGGFSSSYMPYPTAITTITARDKNLGHEGDVENMLLSARVISAEDRVDPAGSYYTSYLMEVERDGWPRAIIEHRYSEFARLHAELGANDVKLRSSFPTKSLCGRLGNWTPAAHWAPEKMAELVTYRKIKLDIWVAELAAVLARSENDNGRSTAAPNAISPDVRNMCLEFFQKSAAGSPPCDRVNPVSWDGLRKSKKSSDTAVSDLCDEEEDESSLPKKETRHATGTEKMISNPVSFTLGSEIRKATYTVGSMCSRSSLAADRAIPLDLLRQAKGLCFLTVIKIGCVVSGRVGTGLVIARRRNGTWSPPSAIGTIGLGYGPQIGGDITSYLIVLNTERAIQAFSSRGGVNLGAELGVAVGPLGRSANGNVNAGSGGVAAAYSYAHSKGFFMGISLEGSVVASRTDVNAKFYGRPVDVETLFDNNSSWTPRAAQPLYDALDEAIQTEASGVRPSSLVTKGSSTSSLPRKESISEDS